MNGQTHSTTTTHAEASTAPKTFRIPVSNGLLAAKHYAAMGESVWLFLYLIDKTTAEKEAGDGTRVGSVLRGVPLHDADIAREFGVSVDTIGRWRKRLARQHYIRCVRTPRGYAYSVNRSKKFARQDTRKALVSDPAQMPDHEQCDPAKARSDTANLRSDTAEVRYPIRQNRGSTETKQKEGCASRTAAFAEVKEGIFAAFAEKFSNRKPTFRDAEEKALVELLKDHEVGAILAGYGAYLENGDEWLDARRFPFCYFAKNFENYRGLEFDPDSWNMPTVEDDRPPDYEENMKKLREEKARKEAAKKGAQTC